LGCPTPPIHDRLAMLVSHDDAKREYAYGPALGLPDTTHPRPLLSIISPLKKGADSTEKRQQVLASLFAQPDCVGEDRKRVSLRQVGYRIKAPPRGEVPHQRVRRGEALAQVGHHGGRRELRANSAARAAGNVSAMPATPHY